jgi:hypothetical protein
MPRRRHQPNSSPSQARITSAASGLVCRVPVGWPGLNAPLPGSAFATQLLQVILSF